MAQHPDRSLETRLRPRARGRRRAAARALLVVVRVLPALRPARDAGTARHVRDGEAQPRVRRRDGLRRACTCRRSTRSAPANAKGRNNALAGGARRSGLAVGDRRRRTAATRACTPSSARSTTSRAFAREARATRASRSRSTSRSSARRIIRTSREHPHLVRAPPRRQRAVRGEPAEEIRGHLSARFRRAPTGERCGRSCATSSSSGSSQGVRVFRVDNPHTKPFEFWRWLIADVQSRHPDTMFLAEAFSAAARDVPAREARLQPVVHVLHVAQHEAGAHGLLHGACRDGATTSGRTSGRTRPTSCTSTCNPAAGPRSWRARRSPLRSARATASTAPRSSCSRHEPREAGSEEYLDSEKYELRAWDLRPRRQSLQRVPRALERDPPRQSPRCSPTRHLTVPTTSTTSSSSATRSTAPTISTRHSRRREPRSAPCAERLHRRAARRMGARRGRARIRHTSSCPALAIDWQRPPRLRDARTRRMPACVYRIQAAAQHVASGTSTTSSDLRASDLTRPAIHGSTDAADDPLWYKDAVIYQLHVRSFFDSNDDGVGDFTGLTVEARLHRAARRQRDLAAAVLPLADARRRLRHRRLPRHQSRVRHAATTSRRSCARRTDRGLKVITELVVNHTSDQHPWFQAARTRPARLAGTQLLRLERHGQALPRDADHLHGHGSSRTGPGTRSPSSTTGTASSRISRI